MTISILVALTLAVLAGGGAALRQLDKQRLALQEQRRLLEEAAQRQQRIERVARRLDRRSERKRQQRARAAHPTPAPADLGLDIATRNDGVLAALRFDGDRPYVVLVLPGFSPEGLFAGIRTAVLASAGLAARLDRPLRVVVLEPSTANPAESLAALRELIAQGGFAPIAASLRLSAAEERDPGGHCTDDVWFTTFWTTAYAVHGLVRRGIADPDRVVYLVQDFEPGFYPWGHLYARALSTYGYGFRIMVNSRSLATFLTHETGRPVADGAIFAPEVEPAPLHAAARRWQPSPTGRIRVLFYARPSKSRNMFTTGVQALRRWAEGLPDGVEVVVRLAGEDIAEPIDLGERLAVEVLGKVSYDSYYDLLADTDVGLALMLSPHPGHLALELPMAGIATVTNGFAGFRTPWVAGLQVAEPDPESLSEALSRATAEAAGARTHTPRELLSDLGGSVEDAVDHVARTIQV